MVLVAYSIHNVKIKNNDRKKRREYRDAFRCTVLNKRNQVPAIEMREIENNLSELEAEKLVDSDVLKNRLEKSKNQIIRNIDDFEVDIVPGYNALKGFEGGGVNVVSYKPSGRREIIVPRNSFEAEKDPGKLDISSGTIEKYDELSWHDLLLVNLNKNPVFVSKEKEEISVPDYRNEEMNKLVERYIREEVKDLKDEGVIEDKEYDFKPESSMLVVPNHSFDVSYELNGEMYSFQAGLIEKPDKSSLEAVLENHREIPDGYLPVDTGGEKSTCIDREVVGIGIEEDVPVTVYQGGEIKEEYGFEEFLSIMDEEFIDKMDEEPDFYGTKRFREMVNIKKRTFGTDKRLDRLYN